MAKKAGPASQSRIDRYETVLSLLSNGKQYKEIAEILNCPIGTVRSTINRGRKYVASLEAA